MSRVGGGRESSAILEKGMRKLFFVVALGVVVGACTPSPPVTVVHLGKNPAKKEASGDAVKFRRPALEAFTGVRSGAYVVRSNEDWQKMWKGASDPPTFPPTFDPMTEMLVLVSTEDQIVSRLKIGRAVETAELMTLFVRQTMLGEGCVRRMEERNGVDAVIVPRADKPLKFYIEDEDSASCGEPPKAEIGCRIGSAQGWSSKLTAKTGDVVECEQSTVAKGKYEVVDQVLSLADAPPASDAKLMFGKGGKNAKLTLDAFGTYAIRAEATDEGGRRGRATATIDVLPKKTRDVLVQLTWADVDTNDLTTPLPRVLLRVTQEGPRGQRCSSEVPVPGLCDAKSRGPYTYMKIPASQRRLPLSLLYLDERAEAGASPCVNIWFNGEKTVSMCDREHRHPEDRWEIGTVETATGKILPPKPATTKPTAPAAAKPAPAKASPAVPAKPAPAKK